MMSRTHAEAAERDWLRQATHDPHDPPPDPTHDPGVILNRPLPPGAVRW